MSDVIITEEKKSAVEADVVEIIAETAEKEAMSDAEEAVVVKDEAAVEKEVPAKKNLRKEILVFVLSFFVPVGMFAAIWASQGITWNGEVTPLIYDMQAQYMPFLASLRYVLSGDASLFYNWTLGMGGSYLSMFAYYIACPLNLITVFFPIEEMPNAIYLLTLIKIGLCGLTFNTFLRYGINKKESRYANVVFTCCYALMSYNIVYSLCIMWLDGIIMLPLILLGIEQILDGKRGLLYCLSIGTLFFSNFYISYMVGIFAFLYLIYAMVIKYTKADMRLAIRSFWRFCVGTLIGGLLSAILLVPALTSYFSVSHIFSLGDNPISYDFSVIDVASKFLPQQYDSLDYGGRPLVYCGTITLVLFLIYFLQRRSIKDKVSTAALVVVLMIGFFFEPVDMLWHGMRYPHCFLFRYAFTVPTVIILGAYRAYTDLKLRERGLYAITITAFAYMMIELLMNGSVMIADMNEEKTYTVREMYRQPIEMFSELADVIRGDKMFHRMGERNITVTWNNQLLFGMAGVDSSASTIDDEVTLFLRNMGATYSPSFSTLSGGLTYTMDTILNIAYRVNTNKMRDEYELLKLSERGVFKAGLYYLPQTLSYGLTIPRDSWFDSETCGEDALINQDVFWSKLVGESADIYPMINPLIPVGEVRLNDISFEFEVDDMKELLLFLKVQINQEEMRKKEEEKDISGDRVVIEVDGEERYSLEIPQANYDKLPQSVYSIGTPPQGGKYTIHIAAPEYCALETISLHKFNKKRFEALYEQMKTKQLEIVNYGSDWLRGNISLEEGEKLFLSIPYIEGLNIVCDGQPVVVKRDIAPFITADLPAGEHEVYVYFSQPNLALGIVLFTIGLILLTNYYFFVYFFRRKSQKALAE